jgi:hypothetical protein
VLEKESYSLDVVRSGKIRKEKEAITNIEIYVVHRIELRTSSCIYVLLFTEKQYKEPSIQRQKSSFINLKR